MQWALPRLGLRWEGFRRVRRQVCRRIGRRLQDLELPDLVAYRSYLESRADEWEVLDSLCRVPISRFARDRPVWQGLRQVVLPSLAGLALARQAPVCRIWSVGCASGEEPYTLSVLWRLELGERYPNLDLEIVATDVDRRLLERARAAEYQWSSLTEVPPEWLEAAFTRRGARYILREEFCAAVRFLRCDVRRRAPHGLFDAVLCRNLVFTYFDTALQTRTLARMMARLQHGGALVVGRKERIPDVADELEAWHGVPGVYRRVGPKLEDRRGVPTRDAPPSGPHR